MQAVVLVTQLPLMELVVMEVEVTQIIMEPQTLAASKSIQIFFLLKVKYIQLLLVVVVLALALITYILVKEPHQV